jgi:hypothetical protein
MLLHLARTPPPRAEQRIIYVFAPPFPLPAACSLWMPSPSLGSWCSSSRPCSALPSWTIRRLGPRKQIMARRKCSNASPWVGARWCRVQVRAPSAGSGQVLTGGEGGGVKGRGLGRVKGRLRLPLGEKGGGEGKGTRKSQGTIVAATARMQCWTDCNSFCFCNTAWQYPDLVFPSTPPNPFITHSHPHQPSPAGKAVKFIGKLGMKVARNLGEGSRQDSARGGATMASSNYQTFNEEDEPLGLEVGSVGGGELQASQQRQSTSGRITAVLATLSNRVCVAYKRGRLEQYSSSGRQLWVKELGVGVRAMEAVGQRVWVGLVNGGIAIFNQG